MQFDSIADFLNMGGHARYVWMAYGSSAVIFVSYALILIRKRSQILKELQWQAKVADASTSAGDVGGDQ